MVLVSPTSNPEACFEFVAEIYLSKHHTNTAIRKGFETTVQIENIRQTVLIIEMDTVRTIKEKSQIKFVIFFLSFRLTGRITRRQQSHCYISISKSIRICQC